MRVVCALLLIAWVSHAKPPSSVCGTERGGAQEALSLHRVRGVGRIARQAATPVGRDVGDIAFLYANSGILVPRNTFNLASKGITIAPGDGGYRFLTGDSVYDQAAAKAGVLIDGFNDDDTRRVALPFEFSFYGKTYTEVWINSDGNVSFESGDSASVTKTIGLLISGPPRIAPLMVDLDPSLSEQGVLVTGTADQFTVTWLEVPEFGASRFTTPQTFQLRLYPDGHMEFAYPQVGAREAVVGISPGQANTAIEVVSLLQGDAREFPAGVGERFSATESLDTVLLARRFYETHEDAYDYLAVYNTLGIPPRAFAVASEFTVRNKFREGFGDRQLDIGAQYGSAARLQAFLHMGPLSQYSSDPYAPVAARASTGDSALSILAHETGHLFLALTSVRDEDNPNARPMLGQAMAHWSFLFNSDASFLEGNRLEDAGERASPRFRSTATVQQYSALDQYLMGFRAPEEVPPTFLVTNSSRFADELPRLGATFDGRRRNVTIEDLIQAEGRRSPDHTVAQREFRMAVILVSRDEPDAADLAKLDRLRSEFETFYSQGTGGRASISTALSRSLTLSVAPAAGVLAGRTVEAVIRVGKPVEQDVTVALTARNGFAKVPPAVTIPAGSLEATLAVTGLGEGVEEISAEAPGYLREAARVQVRGGADDLTLQTISDEQTASGARLVELRVSDINLIPYPGIVVRSRTLNADTDQTAVTDSTGIVRFQLPASPSGWESSIEGTSVSVISH